LAKEFSVIIEDVEERGFSVWADSDKKSILESIEGIISVYNGIYFNRYEIRVDPRYNLGEIIIKVLEKVM
jgi:hypothetical protein